MGTGVGGVGGFFFAVVGVWVFLRLRGALRRVGVRSFGGGFASGPRRRFGRRGGARVRDVRGAPRGDRPRRARLRRGRGRDEKARVGGGGERGGALVWPRRSNDDASSTAWPCFTLRRPLAAGEVRRLNLFEPRWLAMMDRLAEANGGDLVGAELACSLGVNRRYVRRDWDYWADAGGGRAAAATDRSDPPDPRFAAAGRPRSADIVVEPSLRRARVVRFAEGRREVTGARKLEVWIEGAEEAEAEAALVGAAFAARRRRRERDPKNCASARTPRIPKRAFSPRTRTRGPRGGFLFPLGSLGALLERPRGEEGEEEDDDAPCGACAWSGSRTVTASPRGSRERISTRGVKDTPSASARYAVASCSIARLESVHY